jgi:FemAB-related protein (PEP-CTERM system-associated)
MSIRIRVAQATDDDAWDAFTRAHRLGSPFHLIAWKACIQESFGYAPYYLVAEEGESIRGVLPLFLVKSWIIGKALISTPFAVYGGVLADSAEVQGAFRAEVERLAVQLKVDFVEIRNAWEEQKLGFTPINRHVIYAGPIRPAEEEILESIPRKTRRIVRKTLETPFSTRVQTDDFTTFERIYSRNLKRLGTPAFPTKYYRSLLTRFKDSIDIREVFLRGKPVAAVLTLYYQGRLFPYYGAADVEYTADAPTTYMYYDLMRWAGKNGFSTFDFGRSKISSGSGHFKSHWGLAECPLHYEVLPLKGRGVPDITPKNPRYQLAIRIWQMLPLSVTRMLGPWVVRMVPA